MNSFFSGDMGRHDRRNRGADAHPGRHNRSLRLGKRGENHYSLMLYVCLICLRGLFADDVVCMVVVGVVGRLLSRAHAWISYRRFGDVNV